MKTCAICMTQNRDDLATCQACGEGSWSEGSTPPADAEPVREERPRQKPEKRGK